MEKITQSRVKFDDLEDHVRELVAGRAGPNPRFAGK